MNSILGSFLSPFTGQDDGAKLEREIERRVKDSGSVRQAMADLMETNDCYRLASAEAVETVYPLLERVIKIVAKVDSEENKEFIDALAEGLEKLDMLQVLNASADQAKNVTPSPVDLNKNKDSIVITKASLLHLTQKLQGIIADKLVSGDPMKTEKLQHALPQYTEQFNTIVRDLQIPIRKMKQYLKSLKNAIDYLKANPIPNASIGSVSQYMIFLNEPLIEGFSHEIKEQMNALVNIMGIDVEKRIDLITEKVKEWESKHDEYTSILVKIVKFCERIEWRLHARGHLETLQPDIMKMEETIKDFDKRSDTQLKLLARDKEHSLAGAKDEVDKLIEMYNNKTKVVIEELNRRIAVEKEHLKEFQTRNIPASCDGILNEYYFYDAESQKFNDEELKSSAAQSHKEITVLLNELEVQWEEKFKPYFTEIIDRLEKLASSVITKNGEIRSGIVFNAKKIIGYNSIRFPLPNL